jgi:hypothetical protein
VELFQSGAGNRGENMADLLSGFTDYYSHESSGGEDRMKQVVSSEFSNGAAWGKKQEAFGIITNEIARNDIIKHGEEMLALV